VTTAILQPFSRVRSRARVGIGIEAAGTLAVAGLVFIAASFALDRSLRLEVGYRAALLAVLALVVARIVVKRLVRPLRVRLSDDELALAVERHDPPLRQALISAVQFERTLAQPAVGDSRQLMTYVVGEVTERARKIPFGGAIDGTRALRYGSLVVLLVAAVGTWIGIDRGSFKLWFKRNVLLSALEWPRRTQLEFLEPVLRVPQGDDLTLRVGARGEVPEQVELRYAFAGGERGAEPMTLTGDAEFRCTLASLLEPVTVYAEGGDGLSRELRIEIVERPVVSGVRVTVTPPAYLGLPEAEVAASEGDVRVLRGSVVKLSARSDKPVSEAFVLVGEADRRGLTVDADGHGLRGELTPTQSSPLVIDVVDRDRLGTKAPPRLYLRVSDDQAPAVDFKLRGIGSMVTPIALIPGDLTVRDDFALGSLAAQQRVSGTPTMASKPSDGAPKEGEPQPADRQPDPPPVDGQPAPEPQFVAITATGLGALPPGEREFVGPVSIDLREHAKVQPGHVFALRFVATDNFGPTAPHATEGEAAVFRVVTAEELSADLQRRQLEQRKLLETVLAQQITARSSLLELPSPSGTEPRAVHARQKLGQLAKTQRDLGGRCGSIAQTYGQILDEAINNRIAKAADMRGLKDKVIAPLQQLAAEDFPQAGAHTETYVASGQDDLKQVAIATYDIIIGRIKAILAAMQEEERLAAIIAGLREIIKIQDSASDEAKKRREKADADLFGPGRDDKSKSPDKPKDGGNK
jgi:hypothetical protein